MSLFDLFKKKAQPVVVEDTTPVKEEPITWENTTDPDEFFTGYSQAIKDLEIQGKMAAAETLRANKSVLQKAFIDRFEHTIHQKISQITDFDERTDIIITAIKDIHAYNKDMSIDVRTYLAQAKKRLIGD